jgi:pheromone shutdown protein TraB
MTAHSSVILHTPEGIEVHVVGVSHASPFYAQLAAQVISEQRPNVVVLEVDEVIFLNLRLCPTS